MIEISGLILIAYLLFFTVVNACASWFLDFCFEEGNIFGGYRTWLAKVLLGKRAHIPNLRKGTPAYNEELQNIAFEHSFLYKPLGGCVVCFNIWLSVPVYIMCMWLFKVDFSIISHFCLWFIYAVISNSILRKLL
jgi:hypothetical protein